MSALYMILGTLVALGVLVTFHEFGHFWVARRCGVKVLRFSVGFGTPLFRWHDRQGTEFVVAAIPLGGLFGLVSFAGRGKDVLKAGGYSVYALEVQEALEDHPSIAEAAVVGVPDDRMGERVVAAVRLLPGESAGEDELIEWCSQRLSSYKVPTAVKFVDELPRTGTEKVKKDDVRALF